MVKSLGWYSKSLLYTHMKHQASWNWLNNIYSISSFDSWCIDFAAQIKLPSSTSRAWGGPIKGNEGLILSRILTYPLKKSNGWKRKLPFWKKKKSQGWGAVLGGHQGARNIKSYTPIGFMGMIYLLSFGWIFIMNISKKMPYTIIL